MEPPSDICGLSPITVRDLLKAFLSVPIRLSFGKGGPKVHPKRLNAPFIAKNLGFSARTSQKLLSCLISDGWLESRGVPTVKAMALAQYVKRARLPRKKAAQLIDKVLERATEANSRKNTRIRVQSIELFGS
jgi:hypothetical protein